MSSELEVAARGIIGPAEDALRLLTCDTSPSRTIPGTWDRLRSALTTLQQALPQPPVPLQVGDTVTRDEADRVPVGAILRDIDRDAWQVQGADEWRYVGGGGIAPEDVSDVYFPMMVLWLPEPSDAEAGS